MKNKFSILVVTLVPALFFLTACGAEDTDNIVAGAKSAADKPQIVTAGKSKPAKRNVIPTDGVMAKAVDFSTPEDIQKTFQAIEDEAGEFAANQLRSAIDYMLVYDLSVNRNKQKMYKKLNGKTPTQILSMAD